MAGAFSRLELTIALSLLGLYHPCRVGGHIVRCARAVHIGSRFGLANQNSTHSDKSMGHHKCIFVQPSPCGIGLC